MDQRRSMWGQDAWQGNPRGAPPRDAFSGRPFSGGYQGNGGAAQDLLGMARAMRSLPKVTTSREADNRRNQQALPPAREDPYARRQESPRREDPYARRQESPKREDPYARRPGREDPYAMRDGGRLNPGYKSGREDPYARRQEDPYARRNADGPKPREEPQRGRSRRANENAYVKKHDDPKARMNGQRDWTDSPKDATKWPATGRMIPRANYAGYQGRYDQPLQSRRSPFVTRDDARRSLTEYTGSSESDYSGRSGRWITKNKFRFIIGAIVGILLLAMALGGVALWLFLKSDPSPVTYEVKVTLPTETFDTEMENAGSTKFKDMETKYCDAITNVFGGTLLKCVVQRLSKGSVVVLSSLEFDMNDLTDDMKKKNSKLPERPNIYDYINYIKDEIESSGEAFLKDAKASVQVEPETVTYEVKVTLPHETFENEMNTSSSKQFKDMQKKYCDAVTEVFKGTLTNCVVDQLSKGSVIVLSSLDFTWKKLTGLVKDIRPKNISSYIQKTIESSKVDFLKDAKISTQATPETVKYTLKLHMKAMNWTDDLNNKDSPVYKQTATDYCEGMKEAFTDTMSGCNVKGFTEGSVNIESELSFDTKKMKEKAKEDGGSVDLADLGKVVQKQLKKAATESAFFKDAGLDAENITVKSETITPAPTTTTTPATTPMTTTTATPTPSTAATENDGPTTKKTDTGEQSNDTDVTPASAVTTKPETSNDTTTSSTPNANDADDSTTPKSSDSQGTDNSTDSQPIDQTSSPVDTDNSTTKGTEPGMSSDDNSTDTSPITTISTPVGNDNSSTNATEPGMSSDDNSTDTSPITTISTPDSNDNSTSNATVSMESSDSNSTDTTPMITPTASVGSDNSTTNATVSEMSADNSTNTTPIDTTSTPDNSTVTTIESTATTENGTTVASTN